MISHILTSISAFVATNLDDVVVLIVFFAQVDRSFRPWHIVVGQYLGFGALLILSLPGYWGGMLLPRAWIGLLGLVPLAIGIKLLFANDQDDDSAQMVNQQKLQKMSRFCPPQILQVAAITIANGGDNIGIYVPLFASKNLDGLLITIGVFLLMMGGWCWLAWRLVKQPSIGQLVRKYGDQLVPWVLIILGSYILYESGAVTYFYQHLFLR